MRTHATTDQDFTDRKRKLANDAFNTRLIKYCFIGLAVLGAFALAVIGLDAMGGEELVIKGKQAIGLTGDIGPRTAFMINNPIVTTIMGAKAAIFGVMGWRQNALHESDIQFSMEAANADMQAAKLSQALERSAQKSPAIDSPSTITYRTDWLEQELARRQSQPLSPPHTRPH